MTRVLTKHTILYMTNTLVKVARVPVSRVQSSEFSVVITFT